jgi:hypothetical protein
MAQAVDRRLSPPAMARSKLLTLPPEIRLQIYKEISCELEVLLFRCSRAAPAPCSTLVRICQVCHTFLVEARPVFLRTITVFTLADISLQNKIHRLSYGDCLLIRRLVVLVTKEYSHNYSDLATFLPNLEQLVVDLTPWRPAYLDIERAMKSKDTVVITDSDAEYDEDKRIGVNRLFATFEDWVKELAIERASACSKHKFKLIVRLDFVNEPDIDAPATVVVRKRRITAIHSTELIIT